MQLLSNLLELLILSCWLLLGIVSQSMKDADHITALKGDSVILNCHVEFPEGLPVPYVVQWSRRDREVPIYIWYDNYPTHTSEEYLGRVGRVSANSHYGQASLNLTRVSVEDRGWFNCRVLFLNREPEAVNGTWYHLDVHAVPYFTRRPNNITYAHLHESVILTCLVDGTPPPMLSWFKEDNPVKQSNRLGIFNDGTELRISNIQRQDLGDYVCVAQNGEGRIFHTFKLVVAGGAVFVAPPKNQTREESESVDFTCGAEARPSNLSFSWFRDGIPIHSIGSLENRVMVNKITGTLTISPLSPLDTGRYSCQVTNGIGVPIEASSHLTVHYAARVTYNPSVQYVPRGLPGVINCYIEAVPPIQFVTWTKDKRIYDPFEEDGVIATDNGSIYINKVKSEHAGEYICTPYNKLGSAGPSNSMQVVLKDPPYLTLKPKSKYQKSLGASVTMSCGGKGTPKPSIQWTRLDGRRLPRRRHRIFNGELTIDNLRKSDHGVYVCTLRNEVAAVTAKAALVVERTTPHAPQNITISSADTFAVTIRWLPGYSGCAACKQTYKIRYREKDSKFNNWIELPVNPSDARKIQIHNLSANTRYEFQVIGVNEFGDGMYSQIVEAVTKDFIVFGIHLLPRDSNGKLLFPGIPHVKDAPSGEKPGPPNNLTLTQEAGGWVLRWLGPPDVDKVAYYTIQLKKDGTQDNQWMALTDQKIDVDEASYMIKNMGTEKAYLFRVFSHSATAFSVSEVYKYVLPANVKRRAVTAGLIGGILFFIVAIVVSVCIVKICNKKRRKKQERAYNMVTSHLDVSRIPTPVGQMPVKRSRTDRISSMIIHRRRCSLSNNVKSKHSAIFNYFSNCLEFCFFYSKIPNCQSHCSSSTTTVKLNADDGFFRRRRKGRLSMFTKQKAPFFNFRKRSTFRSKSLPARYSLHLEYPPLSSSSPSFICRTRDGKFIVDEGGFEDIVPHNRFRTRSIALIAGYRPDRVYCNVSPKAFVVESGVYKVGADRQLIKSQPLYWKQLVYGSRSDALGNVPRRCHQDNVGRLGAEDIYYLKTLSPNFEPRLRASSPIDQGQPLVEWLSPINNYSDISSVPHNSALSFPSTLLTNPSSNGQDTTQLLKNSSSRGALSTPLQTIHEGTTLITNVSSLLLGDYDSKHSVVKADVHCQHSDASLGAGSISPSVLYPPPPALNIYGNVELNLKARLPSPLNSSIFGPHTYENILHSFPFPYGSVPYIIPNASIISHGNSSGGVTRRGRGKSRQKMQKESENNNFREVSVIDGRLRRLGLFSSFSRQRRIDNKSEDAEVTRLTTSSSGSSPTGGKEIYAELDVLPFPHTTSRQNVATSNGDGPSPFYENWPLSPMKYPIPIIPTFTSSLRLESSLDTPTPPSSAQSAAPLNDVSVDNHYEFDIGTPTPTALKDAELPPAWNRPYMGYNPRRDRELGSAAALTNNERVFSDSEIYSPVFPRGRPAGSFSAEEDVTARVKAMRREFKEYRDKRERELAIVSNGAQLKSLVSPLVGMQVEKLESLI